MKRWIHAAVSPWKTRYAVHWISPDGKDCLLGGSKTSEGANEIAREQADHIFSSPWATNEDKFHFLESIYIYDSETGSEDAMDMETEDYIDNLMSEIDSRIKRR